MTFRAIRLRAAVRHVCASEMLSFEQVASNRRYWPRVFAGMMKEWREEIVKMYEVKDRVWVFGTGPFCGNRSPITGECFINCSERYGGCLKSPDGRSEDIATHRASIATERKLLAREDKGQAP